MNYITLGDYGSSREGAGKTCGDVEGNDRVWAGLGLRTSEIEAGIKASACGSWCASFNVLIMLMTRRHCE